MSSWSVCDLLDTDPTACGWCSVKLKGRQKKWCSRHCNRMFVANHRWTQARQQAKKEVTWFLCANSGYEHSQVRLGYDWCLGFTEKPEVNHLEPVLGKHGSWGCWHHQTGLQVLCRPCHLKATAQQRAEGKF